MLDVYYTQDVMISTHALREEGDTAAAAAAAAKESEFLPTPSARRATAQLFSSVKRNVISTHALREEGDWSSLRPAPTKS